MRTLVTLGIATLTLAAFSCASNEENTPVVDDADGIRAASRATDDCGAGACISTTLTDLATQSPLASVTWNADVGTGTIAQPTRTTHITAESLPEMTLGEANMVARATWLSLASYSAKANASAAPYSEVCKTTVDSSSSSCICTTTTCMFCTPQTWGESCDVHVAHVCSPAVGVYVGRCPS